MIACKASIDAVVGDVARQELLSAPVAVRYGPCMAELDVSALWQSGIKGRIIIVSEPSRQQIFPLFSGVFGGLSDKIYALCHIGTASGSGWARCEERQAAFLFLI